MDELYRLARRTLGREEHNKEPIPWEYILALRKYVYNHPRHTDFVIDFSNPGGEVTCIPCQYTFSVGRELRAGTGIMVFEDLSRLEEHIRSSAHKKHHSHDSKAKADSNLDPRHNTSGALNRSISGSQPGSTPLTNIRTQALGDIEALHSSDAEHFSSDGEEPTSPIKSPRSIIELSSSSESEETRPPASKRKHISRSTYSDKDVIEIQSSDEEATPASQTSRMLTTPRQKYSSANASRPSYSSSSSLGVPRTASAPFLPMGSNPYLPWLHESRPPSQGSSRSASLSVGGSTSGLKRSIYLTDDEGPESTDDGAVFAYTTPDGKTVKRVRYDTEPETDEMGQEDADEGPDDTVPGALGRARANTLMPGHYDLTAAPQPTYAYNAMGPTLPAWQQLGSMGRETFNVFNNVLAMPAASGSNMVHPSLAYHAPLPSTTMPVPQTSSLPSGSRVQRDFNFKLNYNDETPTTWLDHHGANPVLQLQKFFDNAMDDHEGTIPVRDAAKALGLSNTMERLPGMQVALMPHQLIGVAWMLKQELGIAAGGILADDMGLGKTMQTIALITKNRPEKENPRKGTLVVAPAALVDQWKQEIIDRTDDNLFKIRVHHGKDKLRSIAEVKKYDIIITTYQTLTNEFPVDETDMRKKKAELKKKKAKQGTLDRFIVVDSSDDETSKKRASGYGPLAATKWYRVVVDEAQNIRNRSTRSSRVMAMLDAEYRWALTGTPVTNSLADLYGLLRYLHISPFNDWTEFNERIAKIQKRNAKLAGQRAQALLKKCLLRRTKDSKLEGKPLITLPPKTIDMVELDFSPDERQIYAAVEMRQQQKLNKFIRAGTVMKNYSAILVMILRLRQVCNHPQLIAYAAGEFSPENAHKVVEDEGDLGGDAPSALSKTKAKNIMGEENFTLATRQFRETTEEMMRAEFTGGNIPSNDATECPVCFEPYIGNARVTSCGHIFCAGCLNDLFKQALQGEAAANDQFGAGRQFAGQEVRPCPKCRSELTTFHIFPASIFEPTDQEKDEIKHQIEVQLGRTNDSDFKPTFTDADEEDDFIPMKKGKGKANARIEDDEDEKPNVKLGGKGKGEDLVPGAKMLHMLELLKTWHNEAPDDKIIGYSQWTSMIDLMQMLLRRDGFESLRYDGQMKREEREDTLSRFKKHGGPKILLISLKCGGVGLNLTEANRVICMDLAWNAATENQAIDRAHRMGQLKPVVVKRLIVKETIEQRILKLQAEKQNLSDAALGEGNGSKMPRMNVEQLKMLFGMTQ